MDNNKDIEDLKKKVESASKYGRVLLKEGGQIINQSEKLKSVLSFIEIKKLLNEYNVRSWAASANATIPVQPPQNIGQTRSYYLAIGTSVSSATVTISDVIQFESQSIVPEIEQFIPSEMKLDTEEEKELLGYLREFNKEHPEVSDLCSIREGAWQVLNSEIKTKSMLASHSIREILSKIISEGANNDKVMKAKWWKFDEVSKGGVSLRQRLRYLIFGPFVDSQDQKILETINSEVNKAFEADDKLIKIAHGSSSNEVEDAVYIIERVLLNIFRFRKLNENKQTRNEKT